MHPFPKKNLYERDITIVNCFNTMKNKRSSRCVLMKTVYLMRFLKRIYS